MILPNSVQEIADVIGTGRALFLIGKLPRYYKRNGQVDGSRVYLYVPTLARMGLDHDLVRLMGWHDALKLCKAFAGEIMQLASCACVYRDFRDQNIIRIYKEGMAPVKMLASWFDVSERHIKNLLNKEIPHEEFPAVKAQNLATNNKTRRPVNEIISQYAAA